MNQAVDNLRDVLVVVWLNIRNIGHPLSLS
jgi:hypothetical protein